MEYTITDSRSSNTQYLQYIACHGKFQKFGSTHILLPDPVNDGAS